MKDSAPVEAHVASTGCFLEDLHGICKHQPYSFIPGVAGELPDLFMKNIILSLSLIVNLGFVCWGVSALTMRSSSEMKAADVSPKVVSVPTQPSRLASAEKPDAVPNQPSFHWSQLISTDDAEYMVNLRSIGCPENTIRDIITAAIGHQYDDKRRLVAEEKAKHSLDTVSAQNAVAALWDEQNDLIARLFGTSGTFGRGTVRKAPVASSAETRTAVQGSALARYDDPLPLAMREPDPAWGLSADQIFIWNRIADKFVQAVGGPGQDPNDPAYHERWQVAQEEADEQMKLHLGWETFGELQRTSRKKQ